MTSNTSERDLEGLAARISLLGKRLARQNSTVAQAVQPSSSTAAAQDPIIDGLQNLKNQLSNMQAKLLASQNLREKNNEEQAAVDSQNLVGMIPAGPVFWQLFQNLRTDVHSLSSRVSTVERGLSDLEDRVDALEPTLPTPASTATGISAEAVVGRVGDSVLDPPAPFANIMFDPAEYERLWPSAKAEVSERKPVTKRTLRVTELACDGNLVPLNGDVRIGESIRNAKPAVPTFEYTHSGNPVPVSMGQITRNGNRGLARWDSDWTKIKASMDKAKVGWERPVSPNSSRSVPLEGVAFRDQEIDRMDEQLKVLAERCRASDSDRARLEEEISILKLDNERLDSGYARLVRRLFTELPQRPELEDQLCSIKTELQETKDKLSDKTELVWKQEDDYNDLYNRFLRTETSLHDMQRMMRDHREKKREALNNQRDRLEQEIEHWRSKFESESIIVKKQKNDLASEHRLLRDKVAELGKMQIQLGKYQAEREEATTPALAARSSGPLEKIKPFTTIPPSPLPIPLSPVICEQWFTEEAPTEPKTKFAVSSEPADTVADAVVLAGENGYKYLAPKPGVASSTGAEYVSTTGAEFGQVSPAPMTGYDQPLDSDLSYPTTWHTFPAAFDEVFSPEDNRILPPSSYLGPNNPHPQVPYGPFYSTTPSHPVPVYVRDPNNEQFVLQPPWNTQSTSMNANYIGNSGLPYDHVSTSSQNLPLTSWNTTSAGTNTHDGCNSMRWPAEQGDKSWWTNGESPAAKDTTSMPILQEQEPSNLPRLKSTITVVDWPDANDTPKVRTEDVAAFNKPANSQLTRNRSWEGANSVKDDKYDTDAFKPASKAKTMHPNRSSPQHEYPYLKRGQNSQRKAKRPPRRFPTYTLWEDPADMRPTNGASASSSKEPMVQHDDSTHDVTSRPPLPWSTAEGSRAAQPRSDKTPSTAMYTLPVLRRLAKHKSMPHMLRPQLHSYVESASEGEQEGDSE